jgi:hypothetical protein
MLGWLEKKLREDNIREVAKLGYEVQNHGFALHTKRKRVGQYNVHATQHITVGLWAAEFPELVTYGPLDDMSEEVLWRVLAVYLDLDDKPRDGDQVLLGTRRLTLRKVDFPKGTAESFIDGIMVASTYPELIPLRFFDGYQVVGDLEPPVRHYSGTPQTSRSLSSGESTDLERVRKIILGLSLESRGILL